MVDLVSNPQPQAEQLKRLAKLEDTLEIETLILDAWQPDQFSNGRIGHGMQHARVRTLRYLVNKLKEEMKGTG